ncbi:MAG: BtpA/SgcQ family protein [Candidatus Taylorbacteria bacterium]|nr:BtpA/SgcQ family protein [Candidatus Taylorbacteria bacterium]
MSEKLKNIFGKRENIIIGAIHFPPLPGYPDFPGLNIALENALADLKSFETGGVDAIIVENNYDTPHKTFVDPEVADALECLSKKVKEVTHLPVGISVLWNDYKTALKISQKLGLKFIRVPVFVDKVETNYGIMEPKADEIIAFQKEIGAENVALFTDIHVKHSKILSPYSIVESARMAIEKGSDAIIITGKWTGDAPNLEELKKVKRIVEDFPIMIGSGVDDINVKKLFEYANGAIISTSLKEGDVKENEINLKSWQQRISKAKVRYLVNTLNQV